MPGVVVEPVVEVVWALADSQEVVAVDWCAGLTIRQAIALSGLPDKYPAIEVREGLVGIHGLRESLEHPVQPGDRVELYRPLTVSPTEARRLRAVRDR